jgi:hypothetical protein
MDGALRKKGRMRELIRPIGFYFAIFAMLLLMSIGSTADARIDAGAARELSAGHNVFNPDTIDGRLMDRGLIGGRHSQRDPIAPPAGAEVYETVERATAGGQVMSRTISWSEPFDGDTLWIEMTGYPSGQHQLSFWVLSGHAHGCEVFGRTMYGEHGRRLKSEFWRNDRALRITGAADFPADLYPAAVPAIALPRVLDSLHDGARATLSQQITPYGYVDLKITVQRSGRLAVAAGTFAACKVSSQPDVSKLLPNWPHMLLRVVNPFIPATTYYFQCDAPYRFLKKEQQGSAFVGGPEASTELVRYYVAGPAHSTGQAPWTEQPLAAFRPARH